VQLDTLELVWIVGIVSGEKSGRLIDDRMEVSLILNCTGNLEGSFSDLRLSSRLLEDRWKSIYPKTTLEAFQRNLFHKFQWKLVKISWKYWRILGIREISITKGSDPNVG
jgi:hypothetical protein